MTCCLPATDFGAGGSDEVLAASRHLAGDLRQTDLSLPTIRDGAGIRTVEDALRALPGVDEARVNLSARRVSIRWRGDAAPPFADTIRQAGYEAHLQDAATDGPDRSLRPLILALAVAGFSAGNVMMLSMAIWAGADPDTRHVFHWLAAAISLPALLYSGQVFFRPAWAGLRRGRAGMDLPISIGVIAAFGLSLYETVTRGEHAYFDAAVSLLFFLLVGRVLDQMMRDRARDAVAGLARLAARGAMVRQPDGAHAYVAVDRIEPGMIVMLAAGDRVPVDGRVVEGRSDLDCALVSGEAMPRTVAAGAAVQAGTLNLTAPLAIEATARADASFLAEVARMMAAAEAGRPAHRRLADRAARAYAPVVHLTALAAFAGWLAASGDLHRAATIAIAVLIITCPCALALAVPMVQVVAARRLFEAGVMIRDGAALERLAAADHAVFDKTGTLTGGQPRLTSRHDQAVLDLAASLAVHSRHPYSRALAAAGTAQGGFTDLRELPGLGLEARRDDQAWRLGQAGWAAGIEGGVVLAREGRVLAAFTFADDLRPGAAAAIAALHDQGIGAEILSGDRPAAVQALGTTLALPHRGAATPQDKIAHVRARQAEGHKVLMIGDGLNDAPALAAADVSMAPASAADVGRNAADLVFLRDDLRAVPLAIATARRARDLARQNLVLALAYNVIAVPAAVTGLITPLIAAVAMSASSLVVVANALRLGRLR